MGRYTRMLLWMVLGAMAAAAAVGILGVFDVLGRDGEKVVACFASVALFGLTTMGAAVVHEKRVWQWVMRASMALSGVALLYYLAVILVEPRRSEFWAKSMGLMAVWGVVVPYLGLMQLARFDGAVRWVRRGAQGVALLLALHISLIVLWDPDWMTVRAFKLRELLAMLIILTGLGTVGVPVLWWIFGTRVEQEPESTKLELEVKCPRCLRQQVIQSGKSACVECGLKFELRVEEPRCERCGYLLFRLTSPQCPECGLALSKGESGRVGMQAGGTGESPADVGAG